MQFCELMNDKRFAITGNMIKAEARMLAMENGQQSKVSDRWLRRFVKSNNINFSRYHSGAASVNGNLVISRLSELLNLINGREKSSFVMLMRQDLNTRL